MAEIIKIAIKDFEKYTGLAEANWNCLKHISMTQDTKSTMFWRHVSPPAIQDSQRLTQSWIGMNFC